LYCEAGEEKLFAWDTNGKCCEYDDERGAKENLGVSEALAAATEYVFEYDEVIDRGIDVEEVETVKQSTILEKFCLPNWGNGSEKGDVGEDV